MFYHGCCQGYGKGAERGLRRMRGGSGGGGEHEVNGEGPACRNKLCSAALV